MNQDLKHLQLLSMAHYAVGSLMALFSLFPVIHLVIGLSLLSGKIGPAPETGDDPTWLIGGLFVAMASVFILGGMTLAGFVIYNGRLLAQRRRHTWALVVAGVECLFMPFGTVLGVLTLILLTKESVKELFDEGEAGVAV